jgi:Dolichyl-phosphate-mannose-protein mannosyltransferase
MAHIRKVLVAAASWFGWVVLLSIILYPFYKHLYVGLLLVILGGALACLPGTRTVQMRKLASLFASIPERRWLAMLTVGGLLLRLPLIFLPPEPLFDFRFYYLHGQMLARGEGYGGYIFYPPGQSAWLSLWIRLFGSNLHMLTAVGCVLSLATIWIMYAGFARYSRAAAMWASAVVALYPSIVICSGTLAHETLQIFLSAVLFYLMGEASRRFSLWLLMLCGMVAGLAALVRPTFVVVPILIGLAFWISGQRFWRSAAAGAVILLASLAVIAPWTWRNYERFHALALVSTNLGVTLLSSNHAQSDGIWMETMDIGKDLDPINQDKLQRRMAMEYIAADPARFLLNTFKRIVYMWGEDTEIPDMAYGSTPWFGQKIRQALRAVVQLFWVLFAVAVCLGSRRFAHTWTFREAPVWWALLLAALIFCTHAIIEPSARHHLAIIPLLAGIYLPSYGSWLTRSE